MSGLLLDANLLCLLVVGATDRSAIGRHRRLRAYDAADFDTAIRIADIFGQVTLCPQVVAEASNLLGHDGERARFSDVLRRLVLAYEERSKASKEAVEAPEFRLLGVTDAVLALLASDAAALLSADAKLCHAIERRGHRAINYNYVRDGALTLPQIAAWVRA